MWKYLIIINNSTFTCSINLNNLLIKQHPNRSFEIIKNYPWQFVKWIQLRTGRTKPKRVEGDESLGSQIIWATCLSIVCNKMILQEGSSKFTEWFISTLIIHEPGILVAISSNSAAIRKQICKVAGWQVRNNLLTNIIPVSIQTNKDQVILNFV